MKFLSNTLLMSVELHKTVLKRISDKFLVKITRHREFRRQLVWKTFTPRQLFIIANLVFPVLWHLSIRIPDKCSAIESWVNLPLIAPRLPDRTFPERWKDDELGLEIETEETQTILEKLIYTDLFIEPADFVPIFHNLASGEKTKTVKKKGELLQNTSSTSVFKEEKENFHVQKTEESSPQKPIAKIKNKENEPDIVSQSLTPLERQEKEWERLRRKLQKEQESYENPTKENEPVDTVGTDFDGKGEELTDSKKEKKFYGTIHEKLKKQKAARAVIEQANAGVSQLLKLESGLQPTTNARELLIKTSIAETEISKNLENLATIPTLEDVAASTNSFLLNEKQRLQQARKGYRKPLIRYLTNYFKKLGQIFTESEDSKRPEFFVDPKTGFPTIQKVLKEKKTAPQLPVKGTTQITDRTIFTSYLHDKYDFKFSEWKRGEVVNQISAPTQNEELLDLKKKIIQERAKIIQYHLENAAVNLYDKKFQNLKNGKQKGTFLQNFYYPLSTEATYLEWKAEPSNFTESQWDKVLKSLKRFQGKRNYSLLRWLYRDEILFEHLQTLETLLTHPTLSQKTLKSLQWQSFEFFNKLDISPAKWEARILEESAARATVYRKLKTVLAVKKKEIQTRIQEKAVKAKRFSPLRKTLFSFLNYKENYYSEVFTKIFFTKEIGEIYFSEPSLLIEKLKTFFNNQKAPPRARVLPRKRSPASPENLSVPFLPSAGKSSLNFITHTPSVELISPSSEKGRGVNDVGQILTTNRLHKVETQFKCASYQKIEIGESPARWSRTEFAEKETEDEENGTVVERPAATLYYPTPARRTVDVIEGIQDHHFTLQTEGRWRETYAALATQVLQQRDAFWQPLRPWARVEEEPDLDFRSIALPEISPTSIFQNSGTTDEENSETLLQLEEKQELEVWEERSKELYDQQLISLPYQHLEVIPELRLKSAPIRSERFVGPLKGPRFIQSGLHSIRSLIDIKDAASDLDIQDYPYLWDEENKPDVGHEFYDNLTETLEEDAEERDAEGFYEKLTTLRFRPWRLFTDRPYRVIRLANRALGERTRPRRAATERPFRLRDPVSRRVQKVVNKIYGGIPDTYLEGSVNTILLPSKEAEAEKLLSETERIQPWAHYRLGNDLGIAQARRSWWRKWHGYDPELFDDYRRAGTGENDRIGRKNLGWWRSLLPTELHVPFDSRQEGVPPDDREFERRLTYGLHKKAQEKAAKNQDTSWCQHRYIPLGWALRLKNQTTLDTLDLQKLRELEEFKEDFSLGFHSHFSVWKWEDVPYTPWTVIFFYWTYRYRQYGYKRFYEDFLQVRAKFLFQGGIRELDPQWTHWLLEVLGINSSGAAIQVFKPGKRKFKKQLAGLRRELPLLEEWFIHLRYCRRVWTLPKYNPRPSLLVGLPGTGKTSVIRTLADECDVPVVYQCISSFSDAPPRFTQFGFGKTTSPRAIERGFEAARTVSPAIFFIDEIDGRGKNRGAIREEPHPEQLLRPSAPVTDDKVLGLSQLLVEVDSTRKNKGLILVAATNRPEELDPALVRAGRFDRTIIVDLPNRKKRRAILKFYAGRLGRSANLDWDYVVARTIGYTPARLASLANTAAIFAISAGFKEHTQQCFDLAIARLHSPETTLRKQLWENPHVRLREAYYQAARGIISWVLKGEDGLQWLRLGELPPAVPFDGFYCRKDRRNQIQVLRAGRAGECFLVNEVFGSESLDSTRSKPEVAQARRIVRRRNYERSFDLEYWRPFPKLQISQDSVFHKDRKLGEHRRANIKSKKYQVVKGKRPVDELRLEVWDVLRQTPKWNTEWFFFEIPELWNLRWPLWIPPERHRRTKRVQPTITNFITVKHRKVLYEALQRDLWILTDYRAELDLVVAQLIINSSVTQYKVKQLLPDLRNKIRQRQEKQNTEPFILEKGSTEFIENTPSSF